MTDHGELQHKGHYGVAADPHPGVPCWQIGPDCGHPIPPADLCGRCKLRFDPADTHFDGRGRYLDSAFCRHCVNRCHEASEFDHTCVVCATPIR